MEKDEVSFENNKYSEMPDWELFGFKSALEYSMYLEFQKEMNNQEYEGSGYDFDEDLDD